MSINLNEYFSNKPRFNVLIIKGDNKKCRDYLGDDISSIKEIDFKDLVTSKKIDINKYSGYNSLLIFIKKIVKEEKNNLLFISNLDLLLSILPLEKRKKFFQKILQSTFEKDIILNIDIFKDEILINDSDLFNYAKVIDLS